MVLGGLTGRRLCQAVSSAAEVPALPGLTFRELYDRVQQHVDKTGFPPRLSVYWDLLERIGDKDDADHALRIAIKYHEAYRPIGFKSTALLLRGYVSTGHPLDAAYLILTRRRTGLQPTLRCVKDTLDALQRQGEESHVKAVSLLVMGALSDVIPFSPSFASCFLFSYARLKRVDLGWNLLEHANARGIRSKLSSNAFFAFGKACHASSSEDWQRFRTLTESPAAIPLNDALQRLLHDASTSREFEEQSATQVQ